MPRKLTDQKHCSWCGAIVNYKSKYISECTSCGYKNYINYNPCVSILILKDKKLLMLKRDIEPQRGLFDFPGGFMDISDKSIEETVYREVNEEIGIEKNSIHSLKYIGSDVSPYIWHDVELQNACFYFSCIIESGTSIKLDNSENSELRWITESDVENINFAWKTDQRMVAKYFNSKEDNVQPR